MSDGLVVAATFGSDIDAQVARAVLAAHDIPAVIQRDNAGGMLPALDWLVEVRLLVRPEDAVVARSILETGEAGTSQDAPEPNRW